MITKDHLIAFAAGAVLCFLAMWFIGRNSGAGASDHLLRLQRDSVEYANEMRKRDSSYMDLWIKYAHKDDSLTFAMDDLELARRRRPPSAYRDADSLHSAIRKEVGLDPR